MIRIVTNHSELTGADLVGKIVFKLNHFRWPGYASPRLVTSVSKSRVNVATLPHRFDRERGVHVIIAKEAKESEGYITLPSVALVVDTLAEANLVLAATKENHDAMVEFERQAMQRLQALDGLVLNDPVPEGEREGAPRP